jgi:hypothetical protein
MKHEFGALKKQIFGAVEGAREEQNTALLICPPYLLSTLRREF